MDLSVSGLCVMVFPQTRPLVGRVFLCPEKAVVPFSPRQSRQARMTLRGREVATGVCWPGVVVADRRGWIVRLGDGVPEGHD